MDSPLGVPAGPLLNSRWIRYYAALGFSVLTYKTVRSRFRRSYDPPNLVPVESRPLTGVADRVRALSSGTLTRSWAISFGMPSKEPKEWQDDVTAARLALRPGQVLVVSVVASPESGWDLSRIIRDFTQCARWARDAGAQAIEANLSCPNVCTQEGQLFTSPEASARIAAAMKDAAAELPLILKIGIFPRRDQAEAFIAAVSPHADCLSTVNSISASVDGPDGAPLFGSVSRGIGGECIRQRCLQETRLLREIIAGSGATLRQIGVGGVFTTRDVLERLAAGAHHVQLATAAMLDPLVAIRIRRELAIPDQFPGQRPA